MPYLFAALNSEIADAASGEAHLLPAGAFRASDGRPRDCAAFRIDAGIAAKVIRQHAARKNDTLIDYEHQSLRSEKNGQPAPAAGWFKKLEWRDGKGLFAAGISWTDKAKNMIAAREYRYVSCVVSYRKGTGEIAEVVSVALTNEPALDGLDSLAALSRHSVLNHDEDEKMSEEERAALAALTAEHGEAKKQLAALTAEREAEKKQIAALTAERDAAQAALKKAADEKAAETAKAEQAERDALLADLKQKIEPARVAKIEGLDLAALKAVAEVVEPSALLDKQTGGERNSKAALSKEALDICEALGVSHDDFRKAQEGK
jgi:phage I-like protein